MARFLYRMQNILDIKLKLEVQSKNEFALANARLLEEENKLAEMENRKDAYERELCEVYSSVIDINKVRELQEAIESMKYIIEDQNLKVKHAEKQVDIAREDLAEKVKERKTHERLKERQFEQFMQEEAARESKEIDELVSYRFGQADEGNQ